MNRIGYHRRVLTRVIVALFSRYGMRWEKNNDENDSAVSADVVTVQCFIISSFDSSCLKRY